MSAASTVHRLRSTGIALPIGLLLLAACGGKSTSSRTEHPAAGAQESALARSKLPGASGVGAALRLQDSAAARRAREDSISRSIP